MDSQPPSTSRIVQHKVGAAASSQRPAALGSPFEFQVPVENAFTFLFSSPWTRTNRVVQALPAQLSAHAHTRPVPPQTPIFHSPQTGSTLSFALLHSLSLRIAAGLSSLQPQPPNGTSKQPTILLHLPNSLAFPSLVFGALAAKWIVTMANPALAVRELAHIVREARPDVVVTTAGADGRGRIEDAWKESGIGGKAPKLFIVRGVDGLGGFPVEGHEVPEKDDWRALLEKWPQPTFKVAPMTEQQQRETIAFILWSSGTTGKSKGVILSHHGIVSQAVALWAGNPVFGEREIFCGLPPFFHTFGLGNILLLAPTLGATVVLFPKFDLPSYLSLISTYRLTHLHIVPPIAVQLAKSPLVSQPGVNFSSVTGVCSGGAPLGAEVIREVWRRCGVVVKMGYGTSETGSITTMVGDAWGEIEPQLGSTGSPLHGLKVKIIRPDGSTANIGEAGEILVKSPLQMLGYVNNEEATRETIDQDGWIHTGDVGIVDEGERIWIVDRLKEVIKYKGFQVSPSELDAVLNSLPSVADAGTTSVYSASEGTELPIAYVAQRQAGADPRALAQEIREWTEKNLAKYKWLRAGVVVCEAIPRNPSGKILRRELKNVKGLHVELYPKRESKL